ncbi:MAG: sugar transferase [Anaerolineales bacterium]|nr:sugar transferase [Anaerolineales bacterium]
MLRRFSVNFALFSMALDALLVAAALFFAEYLRPALSGLAFAQPLAEGDVLVPDVLYVAFPLIWLGVMLLFDLYDGRRNLRLLTEFSSLTLGTLLAGVASAGLLYLSFRDVSRLLFVAFLFSAFAFLLLWRLGLRALQRWRGFRVAQRRVLVVGGGELGQRVRAQLTEHAGLGLEFIGFLADGRRGKDVLGSLAQARQVTARRGVDDVVIALPAAEYARVGGLLAELHDQPVRTWVIPDYFSLALHRAQVEDFAGLPMLDLRAPALSDSQRLFKRAFDVMLVLLSAPLTLPLMAVCGLAVRLQDGGPALLRQTRVGENGRLFSMVKFRSMRVDAARMRNGAPHKQAHDPRVTPVGRWLRRTSLDELPQLWNVFKGEMSLVGPRPELPELVENYQPWQRKRFAVPQGMTGWWQVNGRSDKPMHLHTEEDLYYVQNYSVALDLLILLRTFWAVLGGRGAF